MKRFVAVLGVIVMVMGCFAGCSKKGEDGKETSNSSKDMSYLGHDLSKKVKISINIIDTDLQDKDARYDFLKEKFNCEFDLVSCSLNDVKEKVRMWVVGGGMPDALWSDIDNASELRTWIDGGALKQLPDLSAYPNLKAIKDKQKSDDSMVGTDGKDYFIATMQDNEKINFMAMQCFMYRKDWAKELGMYKETYTWEEMLDLAKAMAEKDPGKNGAGKTIGMVGVGWAYPQFSGIQQISPYYNSFVKVDGSYVWGGSLPETLDAIEMAKRMYDENVIWKEQSLAKVLDGPSKFQVGLAGICYHNFTSNNIQNILNGLKETYPGQNVLDMVEIMDIKSPDGTRFGIESPDSWGNICFRSDVDDVVMERLLCIMDYLASEEGLMLQHYGLEGTDYKKTEDGKIEMLWEKDSNGKYICPYEVNSDRLLSISKTFDYERNFTEYANPEVRVIIEQMNKYFNSDNMKTLKQDYEFKAFSGPKKDQCDLGGQTKDKVLELIISSHDIRADYQAWLKTVESKANEVLEELNAK